MESVIEEEEKQDLHIVMLPWLAHGNIISYVELGKRLSSRGLRISIVTTPLNIKWIKEQLLQKPETLPGMDLVEMPLPSVQGLPAGVESTADLKRGGTLRLLTEASDGCEKPFEAVLQRLSPDLVIHDVVQYWAPQVASRRGIPCIFFFVVSAAAMGHVEGQFAVGAAGVPTVEDLLQPPPAFPSSAVRFRLFEARKLAPVYVVNNQEGRGISMTHRIKMCEKESWAIACNTCRELEGVYMDYWLRAVGLPVFPLGILTRPLPPPPPGDPCLAWLDRQAVRSALVVSFGSECTPTREEVRALLVGLEESLIPYLCVLLGQGDALPGGFDAQRGIVVTEWAPQLHILSHPSAGAFLTNCGWVSVTEALRFGVPLVALPMQHEQGLTARLVAEELRVGVEVRRNEEDGSFSKDDICKAVRDVMVEEKGRDLRSKAEEISRILSRNDYEILENNINNFVSLIRMKASIKHI